MIGTPPESANFLRGGRFIDLDRFDGRTRAVGFESDTAVRPRGVVAREAVGNGARIGELTLVQPQSSLTNAEQRTGVMAKVANDAENVFLDDQNIVLGRSALELNACVVNGVDKRLAIASARDLAGKVSKFEEADLTMWADLRQACAPILELSAQRRGRHAEATAE